MKLIKSEVVNGKTELTVEYRGVFFFKRTEKYIAVSCIVGDCYNWVKAPNKTIVSGSTSYQLDSWKQTGP